MRRLGVTLSKLIEQLPEVPNHYEVRISRFEVTLLQGSVRARRYSQSRSSRNFCGM